MAGFVWGGPGTLQGFCKNGPPTHVKAWDVLTFRVSQLPPESQQSCVCPHTGNSSPDSDSKSARSLVGWGIRPAASVLGLLVYVKLQSHD